MSVKIIDGDLFSTSARFICHQVNCMGRMGSGVAKQVRAKYPEAYLAYKERHGEDMLGISQFIPCHDGKVVVNMFAQKNYGYDGKQYTSYDAFRKCLDWISQIAAPNDTIAMPYKIGCGLGGGDWDVIYSLISETIGKSHTVELWKLG